MTAKNYQTLCNETESLLRNENHEDEVFDFMQLAESELAERLFASPFLQYVFVEFPSAGSYFATLESPLGDYATRLVSVCFTETDDSQRFVPKIAGAQEKYALLEDINRVGTTGKPQYYWYGQGSEGDIRVYWWPKLDAQMELRVASSYLPTGRTGVDAIDEYPFMHRVVEAALVVGAGYYLARAQQPEMALSWKQEFDDTIKRLRKAGFFVADVPRGDHPGPGHGRKARPYLRLDGTSSDPSIPIP